MIRSLTIARVHGIDVRLHPTIALVLLWVLVDWRRLGAGTGLGPIVFTLLLVLLAFACVLIHEFGHAYMARQHGVRVHDVSLSAVGGVARMDQLPGDARAEMLIALAGPAANLALTIALAPIVLLAGVLSGFASIEDYAATVFSPSLTGLFTTLLYVNVLIMVFNMLPAFPMDGGRVFRSFLTPFVGRASATRIAVVVGEIFAVSFLLFGLFVVQSIVVVLLALFVMVVAYAEDRAVRIESALRRLRVGQFALWDLGGIAPQQPLSSALRGGPRDMAVTEGGRVVGMLWRNRLLAELGGAGRGRTVADVMETPTLTVEIDLPVYEAQRLMSEQECSAVPVTEDGVYRGIFTSDRLLHIYRQLSPDPIQAFRELVGRGAFKGIRV